MIDKEEENKIIDNYKEDKIMKIVDQEDKDRTITDMRDIKEDKILESREETIGNKTDRIEDNLIMKIIERTERTIEDKIGSYDKIEDKIGIHDKIEEKTLIDL